MPRSLLPCSTRSPRNRQHKTPVAIPKTKHSTTKSGLVLLLQAAARRLPITVTTSRSRRKKRIFLHLPRRNVPLGPKDPPMCPLSFRHSKNLPGLSSRNPVRASSRHLAKTARTSPKARLTRRGHHQQLVPRLTLMKKSRVARSSLFVVVL
ncbi:hypothetical protein BDZ89DRAFT_579880 [Hymenopellis radicata]|nr:hypothetical protein BDZ89DRAFT_579880 [Hymenopellis radicata]